MTSGVSPAIPTGSLPAAFKVCLVHRVCVNSHRCRKTWASAHQGFQFCFLSVQNQPAAWLKSWTSVLQCHHSTEQVGAGSLSDQEKWSCIRLPSPPVAPPDLPAQPALPTPPRCTSPCCPNPGKFVVRDLIPYERNVVSFQNQRFPTRQSMSFLKGERFLFFSHKHAQT